MGTALVAQTPMSAGEPLVRKRTKPHARLCKCTSKRTGQPCGANAMDGSEVCYHHGGMTPRGIASPNFKTGDWAQDLPAKLRDKARRAYSDPDLLSQKQAISILQSRFWDVVAQSEQGETGELWNRLYAAAQAYRTANGKDAENTRRRSLNTILDLIDAGYNEREAWQELREITQEMRLLRESEQKSLVNKSQTISNAEAMVMLGHVTFAVRDAASLITDPEQRKAVLDSVSRTIANLVNTPER